MCWSFSVSDVTILDMARYVVFDVETPNRYNDRMSAIGITVVEEGAVVQEFYTLVNPQVSFDSFNVRLTGINEQMVAAAPTFPELWKQIEPLLSEGILVAHNAVFDLSVLRSCLQDYGIVWKDDVRYLCTVQMGRRLLPGMRHNLDIMCDHYHIALDHHHADSDSRACAEILLHYFEQGAEPRQYIRTYHLQKQPERRYGMADFTYEIIETIGILSENAKGWRKELNKISWNGATAKYDIRDWAPDHSKMGKGITLTEEEAIRLKELL